MAGRPTKLTPETQTKICDALRAGNTRKASCQYVGISEDTFARYLNNADFADSVTRAEAECEVRNALVLQKAAGGWDTQTVTETTKTVIKTRTTKLPDGTVIEEPVSIPDMTRSVVSSREFDWRAALEWLKRRKREDWGDNIAVGKMSDEELIAYVAGSLGGDAPPRVDA